MALVIATRDRLPRDPRDPLWSTVAAHRLRLVATPTALQTSPYLREHYRDGSWGATRELTLAAIAAGASWAFRLSWSCPKPMTAWTGPDAFLDRVALIFAADPATPLPTMGDAANPVRIWSWRADGRSERLVAAGAGTIAPEGAPPDIEARHADGRWSVVLHGRAERNAQVASAAVWSGARRERGGLKAYHPAWLPLSYNEGS